MVSEDIRQFLQDMGAEVPAEFTSDIDDALDALANSMAYLVGDDASSTIDAEASRLNVEYDRVDPKLKVSTSEAPDELANSIADSFPIHKRAGDCI